jgi:predicted membrane channel-forming protein YqfA (hemolysin III family)
MIDELSLTFALVYMCVAPLCVLFRSPVDYASICLSIFCTCAVFGRFAFYCLPDQQSFFYVSLAGLFLSTIVAVLFVSSNAVRTGSFLLFVLFSTGVPLWYTLGLKWAGGAADDVPEAYVMLWLVSLGCFGVGLGFKSSGFPESLSCGGCIKPGTFDVWGGSHANWHLCINAGNARQCSTNTRTALASTGLVSLLTHIFCPLCLCLCCRAQSCTPCGVNTSNGASKTRAIHEEPCPSSSRSPAGALVLLVSLSSSRSRASTCFSFRACAAVLRGAIAFDFHFIVRHFRRPNLDVEISALARLSDRLLRRRVNSLVKHAILDLGS